MQHKSKLGLHVQMRAFDLGLCGQDHTYRSSKILLPVDDGPRLAEADALDPTKTFIVGKALHRDFIIRGQSFGPGLGEAYAAGILPDEVAQAAYEQYQRNLNAKYPEIQAFEWFNEYVPATEFPREPQIIWYARVCARLGDMLRNDGKTPVLGGWATGSFQDSDWPYWMDALESCRRNSGFVSVHCYGPLDEWYAFRWKRALAVFDRMGYPEIQIMITECGADGVMPGWGPWQSMWGSLEEYISAWVIPFELEIRREPRVAAAHLYSYGDGGVDSMLHNVADHPKMAWHRIWGDWLANNPWNGGDVELILPPNEPPIHYGTVSANALNIRQFPWSGDVEPPKVGLLLKGISIPIYDIVMFGEMNFGWGLISEDGNQWVSLRYVMV